MDESEEQATASDTSAVTDPTASDLAADVAAVLARMGGVLLSAQTVDTAMDLVVRLADQTIPHSAGAGVTVADGSGQRTSAATDPVVEQADALQYELGSGPCLTAWRDRVVVRIDNVASEQRWPAWCHAAADLGVASVLSSPLVAGEDSIGAIKVYARIADAFNESAAEVLALFADQAAILLANTQTMQDARQMAAELARALEDREVIGQAKGILIDRGAVDAEAAFRTLVGLAQRTDVRLVDVARQLVDSVTAGHQRSGSPLNPGSSQHSGPSQESGQAQEPGPSQ